jgi:S-adenosylmethionine synthetase
MTNNSKNEEVEQSIKEIAEIVVTIIGKAGEEIQDEDCGCISVPIPPNSKFEELNEIVEHVCNYQVNQITDVPVWTQVQNKELRFYRVDNLDKVDVDPEELTKAPESLNYLIANEVIEA